MDVKEQLSYQYKVLGHKEGEVTEIRALPSGVSCFATNEEEFIAYGEEVIKDATKTRENLYVGVQPRGYAEAGRADTIPRISTLVLDIDPVRPKNEPSTSTQLTDAISLGKRIVQEIPGSIGAISGSGFHVYIPINSIEVKDQEALSDSLRAWFTPIKEKYDVKDKLKLDPIFDLPRIIRLAGSHNFKSDRTCYFPEPLASVSRNTISFNQEPKAKAQTPKSGSEVEQRFERLAKTNKRLGELFNGTIAFGSPSEADFQFVAELSKAQFSQGEVRALWSYNTGGNSEPKKGDIERIFKKVSGDRDVRAFSLANNVGSYYDSLGTRTMGIRTGFNTLDEMVSGLKDGKLYIIGARPTTGKTTLITQILTNIAEQGIPCLFFPTEVGAEPIIDKILAVKGNIQLKKFQNGTFSKDDVSKIQELKAYLPTLPLTIYEDFGLNIERFEQEVDKYAPKVVVLDYFQALRWEDSGSVGEKESAVRRIKKITKDRNIITICLSQLNRSPQGQGKANLAELKGTGSLEELGDVIAQMYRVETSTPVFPIPIDLVVTKSKYSAAGTIAMKFDNTIGKFTEHEIQTG